MDALTNAFESGRLIRPDTGTPNFVDLVRVLAKLSGVRGIEESVHVSDMTQRIGNAKHLIFVLVDGLGVNLLSKLPAHAFLREHAALEMRSVFPSTTACALTSLATGCWPSVHGVPGWWAYVEENNLSVTTLPFVERMTEAPLSNLPLSSLWPLESLAVRTPREYLAIQPAGIWNSIFSRYLRGRRPAMGYHSIPRAIDQLVRHMGSLDAPSYTYLYLPELDSACHEYGIDSAEVRHVLNLIERELERLASELCQGCCLIISADHGHLNVYPENRLALCSGDPILDLLKAPPAGEPRTPQFHVKDSMGDAFTVMFRERFGHCFALLSQDEASAMELYGPGPMSDHARRRFGDYVAVALDHVTLRYYARECDRESDHLGRHAGLDEAEMRIPLILMAK